MTMTICETNSAITQEEPLETVTQDVSLGIIDSIDSETAFLRAHHLGLELAVNDYEETEE